MFAVTHTGVYALASRVCAASSDLAHDCSWRVDSRKARTLVQLPSMFLLSLGNKGSVLKYSGSSRGSPADNGGGAGPRHAASSHSVHGCLLGPVIHKTLVASTEDEPTECQTGCVHHADGLRQLMTRVSMCPLRFARRTVITRCQIENSFTSTGTETFLMAWVSSCNKTDWSEIRSKPSCATVLIAGTPPSRRQGTAKTEKRSRPTLSKLRTHGVAKPQGIQIPSDDHASFLR